jgi:hypothetical protein
VSPVVLVSCGIAVVVAFAVLGVAVVSKRSEPAPIINAITVPATIEPATTATTARPSPGTTARSLTTEWRPWTSPDLTFAAEFPGTPDVTEEDTRSEIISSENRASVADVSGAFTIYWSDLVDPKYAQDTAKVLDVFLDSRYDPAKVTVTSRERARINGLPALRYTATSKILNTSITGAVVVYRTRVFELSVLGLPFTTPDFERFINSFRLTKSA